MRSEWSDEEYAYLTTTGRRTGAPHEIEIWFAVDGATIWMISGGRDRSDWVQNLLASPDATLRIGEDSFPVRARLPLTDPVERAASAHALHAKYSRQVSATEQEWADGAYLIAYDRRGDG